MDARASGAEQSVLREHLNAALAGQQQALAMVPPDNHETLAVRHGQLGNIYVDSGDTRQALHHYQQALQHQEARGDAYNAGNTRFNIALLFNRDGRIADALLYARAALHDYERIGVGAAQHAAQSRELIAELEGRLGEGR